MTKRSGDNNPLNTTSNTKADIKADAANRAKKAKLIEDMKKKLQDKK